MQHWTNQKMVECLPGPASNGGVHISMAWLIYELWKMEWDINNGSGVATKWCGFVTVMTELNRKGKLSISRSVSVPVVSFGHKPKEQDCGYKSLKRVSYEGFPLEMGWEVRPSGRISSLNLHQGNPGMLQTWGDPEERLCFSANLGTPWGFLWRNWNKWLKKGRSGSSPRIKQKITVGWWNIFKIKKCEGKSAAKLS